MQTGEGLKIVKAVKTAVNLCCDTVRLTLPTLPVCWKMRVSAFLALQGPERGYLDNTKHFIFWLFKMKQLSFRHFNTNSKKNLWNNIYICFFFQKEAKPAPKRPILFCLVYQAVFGHFTTIFRRFPNTIEDFRRQTNSSDHCRRCLKNPLNT